MIAFENVAHLQKHASSIARFAAVPLEREAMLALIGELQWRIVEDHSLHADVQEGLCLRLLVRGTEDLRVHVLIDSERQVGVPLVWLIDESRGPDPAATDDKRRGLIVASITEYHRCYDEAFRLLSEAWGIPARQGEARSAHPTGCLPQTTMYRHSLWEGHVNWLSLMEHDEGDGHCGIAATVDIRVLPGSNEPLEFPLRTNLIF